MPEAGHLHLPADAIVDCVADMHLQRSHGATWAAFAHYLQTTPASHILLLGDVFEVWVGDDALQEPGSFEAEVARQLRAITSDRENGAPAKALYLMHGNRDFLIGPAFAQASGVQLLADPTVLHIDAPPASAPSAAAPARWLLSHGDALCTDDLPYQHFRAMSRQSAWQQPFLAQPLATRRAFAASIRSESEQRKAGQSLDSYVDLNADATRAWLRANDCATLIHGHTHQPGTHDLGEGLQRIVLSDWDLHAHPPRAQALRIAGGQCQRIALT